MMRNVWLVRAAISGALVLSAVVGAGWKWDCPIL